MMEADEAMIARAINGRSVDRDRAGAIEAQAVLHRRHSPSRAAAWARRLFCRVRDGCHGLGTRMGAAWRTTRRASLHPETVDRARAYEVVARELALAGRIQAGLLPNTMPRPSGWDVAAALEPARETWGDFYDFISLPGGRTAIVVADVVDKGMGAALYMALTRTLLRSVAALYPDDPAFVIEAVNNRILSETQTGMFVTVLYAVLEPESGAVTYVNGGHNPAYLFEPDRSQVLAPTGMALGVLRDARWEARTVTVSPGDTLFFYTDGAIDAQAPDGSAFGLQRLLSTAQAQLGRPCAEIQVAVLEEIHRFVGLAPRFDDITLMVVART